MPGTHALLNPSSSDRWANCPASVLVSLGVEETPSEYAQEGTTAHRLAQLILDGRTEEERNEMEAIKTQYPQMQDCVLPYVDFVARLFRGAEYRSLEMRVELSTVTGEEGAKGTIDCCVVKDNTLHIVDLKYGMGVPVNAERNSQLSIYALGALEAMDLMGLEIDTVLLTIVQPRLDHIDTWEFTKDEQEKFRKKISESAKKALALVNGEQVKDSDFAPSEKTCRWCRGKAKCPCITKNLCEFTNLDEQTEVVEAVPAPSSTSRFEVETPEGLARALAFIPVARQWCDAVEQQAQKRALEGLKIPGFKLVEGRKGIRKWRDEAEAEKAMSSLGVGEELLYEKKLVSPTKAEKFVKKGALQAQQWDSLKALVTQSEGKPQLVPENDKRPAISVSGVEECFITYEKQ